MRKTLIFVGALVCVDATQLAHADDHTLRLADVIAVAVRDSPELSRARIDVDVARAAYTQAQGIEDTHVGATASYQGTREQAITAIGNDRAQILGLSVFATRLLPTGGLATLSAGDTRTSTVNAFDGVERTGYESTVSVSLTQPLLKGYGAGTVAGPIEQAHQFADAATLQQEARARDLVVAITLAYWQVVLARNQLEVRRHSHELAQKALDFTEAAIRSDKVAKAEMFSVQVALSTRQQDVNAAEQTLLERSLALRQLAGLEITPDNVVVETEPLPKIQTIDLDIAKFVAGAFEHSATLAQLAATKRAAQAGLDRAESLARSRLDLGVTAGPVATGATFGKSLTNIVGSPGYGVTASLTYDHAIQARIESGALRAAHASVEHAVVEERAARADIALRASRALQRAKTALANVTLGDQAIAFAEQNIDAEQHKFELGRSSSAEVLRRQDELELAHLRRISSIVDYWSARAELEGLTDAILKRFGVVLR